MRPLEGIRVLDLGWVIAGPLTSRLLADFGADVIRVETSRRMDVSRGNSVLTYGDLPGDANSNPDTGGFFWDVNAGKRSCALNLAFEAGKALLRRLAMVSDVIICNLGGDQLARWDIGYELARELNPAIVVVNMPLMESSGPRTRWRAFGDQVASVAGLMSVSGWPDDPPLPFVSNYPDFSSNPMHAVAALMAALFERERTGLGQFVEASQYESTAALLGAAILDYTANGRVAAPAGNTDAIACPHNLYRCRGDDAWCAIAIETDAQWQALAAVAGLETLARQEYATVAGRRQHEAQIDKAIEAWTRGQDRQDVAALLQSRGVPAGPMQNVADLVETDPLLGERYFNRFTDGAGREFVVHGDPFVLRRSPAEVRPAPGLGEHTYAVLHDLLGLSAEEIAAYTAAGVLE